MLDVLIFPPYYAAVTEDVKFQMRLWFSRCRVLVCKREANHVAHELARLGHHCNPLETLWSNVLALVAAVVVGEIPTKY